MNSETVSEASLPDIPVTIRWVPRTVPAELQAEARRLLSARAPRVYRERIEKVRVEGDAHPKPRASLFGPGPKKPARWKTRVVREPVQVPPEPRFHGYVRAGETVATLSYLDACSAPQEEALQGAGDPGALYLGDHLRERAGSVQAEADGFFRIGPNWIDLLPYRPGTWALARGEDPVECRIDFTPGSPGAATPPPDRVLAEAEALGFHREDLLPVEELAEMLQQAGKQGLPLVGRSIRRREDAEIRIEVSEDRLNAFLTLKKGQGEGKPLSLQEIGEAIRARRFKGMDLQRVRGDLLAFHRGPQRVLDRYLLVEGRKPCRGGDGSLQWVVRFLDRDPAEALKAAALGRPESLSELRSLEELPIEEVQDMAMVQEQAKVAEIIPATVGEAGMDVFGAVIPGLKGEEPELKLLDNLMRMRTDLVSQVRGVLERRRREGVTVLRARPHLDGEVQVRLAEDRMTAFLTLMPAAGTGRQIDPEEVDRRLAEAEVRAGIEREALARAVLEARGGKTVLDVPIARGTPPRHGPDRSLRFLVQLATGKGVTVDGEGRAHYKRQDRITSVAADTPIAEIPPPGASADGEDVSGRVLPAEPGRPPDLTTGRNVRREDGPDGSCRFIATAAGELQYTGSVLDVVQVHSIQGDVGLGTGNIRFTGSVRVGGSVQSGFGVLASGSILVNESVYGSLLSADERIVVTGGVKGAGKGILRSRQEIRCLFAEQASLLCVGDIHLQNAALHCSIKCNGRLSLHSDRGHLIGGLARARHGLSVANLGSEREVQTAVGFGQDYLVAERIELEEKEVKKLKEELRRLDEDLTRRVRSTPPASRLIEELHRRKVTLLKTIEKRRQRLFHLRERFEQHFPSEVVVRGTAFPGVILESHGRVHRVLTRRREVRFIFNAEKGRIEETPLSGR